MSSIEENNIDIPICPRCCDTNTHWEKKLAYTYIQVYRFPNISHIETITADADGYWYCVDCGYEVDEIISEKLNAIIETYLRELNE
jgi:hypothetical protein